MATKTKEKTPSPPVEYASGQSGPKGLSPQAQTAKPQDAGETRDRAQSATGAGRGMDKIRDEMAKSQGKYVQVVGEYMTTYLLQHPEAEAAILSEGKTIAGSLKAMEAEARKVKTGNVAVLDDQTAFEIVLGYYGLNAGDGMNGDGGPGAAATEDANIVSVMASQHVGEIAAAMGRHTERLRRGEITDRHPDNNDTATDDLFDLEALLGVM